MPHAPLVTLSASYGAGGTRVGPELAERLGVVFLERVMKRRVADHVAGPLAEASRGAHPVGRSLGRLLRQAAGEQPASPPLGEQAEETADEDYQQALTQEMRGLTGVGVVILGRAAAVVLGDVPHALHVRISGPTELRVQQAMVIDAIDEATARWRQATEDMARDAYVRHFHGTDPEDPALYHLSIDSTRLPLSACVDAIAAAARAMADG